MTRDMTRTVTPNVMESPRTERAQVLVVGGALTGLSSAVLLAHQGVRTVLAERHPDLLVHPRLRGLTPRAVEVFRQVGLEPAIRAAAFADPDTYAWHMVRAETLADGEWHPVEEPAESADDAAASPVGTGPIDQDRLELLLRDRARELGADLRYGTEVVSVEQASEAVTAVLRRRDTGEETTVVADYLIAADGAQSPIRRRLGIASDGPGVLYHTLTALIDADLTPATRGRPISIAYLNQPQPFTILMAHDDVGRRWVFGTGYDPGTQRLEDVTPDRVRAMVRAATGLPDADIGLRPQIPGTDVTVLGFPIGAQVARTYQVGRIFLAGDAARINPPTGGLGGSTGVQDAHNLAWKLAAVLHGYAGPGLLETYTAERRPVGALTMEQAWARFGGRMGAGAEVELIDHARVAMGYRYRSSAVLGAPEDIRPIPPGELGGQPGTRAPHVEVADVEGGSTLDLYGREFVVLLGRDAADATESADSADSADSVDSVSEPPASDAAPRIRTYRLDAEGEKAHGIGADGALLVRPDGFVAWRVPTGSPGRERLAEVLDTVLARRGRPH